MYREDDYDLIREKLNQIEKKALKYYQDNFGEPTREEYDKVMNDIKKFIKERGLIIYGGYAQNRLIGIKNSKDEFYDETDRPDLEIYSPEPIKDSMEMADMLFNKGYKYVVCEEGVHNETYKVFVNFLNFSDISYMDPYVFQNCPYILDNGIKLTHPLFMQTDAYRVYADLLTSNFRLTKTFCRMGTLMRYYPFEEKAEYNKLTYKSNENINTVLRFLRKHIIQKSKLVVIGQYAFNYFAKKLDDKKVIDVEYYQLLSSNFREDFDKIIKAMKKQFGKDIHYKLHYPFFQFFDERVEIFYKNKVILKLYGNNDKCIVYKHSDKKRTNFGTFILTILYLIADYNFHIVNKNKEEESNILSLIIRLNKIRNEYLEKNKLTVLDSSPFEEFTYKCFGEPIDPLRASRLKMVENKDAGKRIKFRYNPTGKPGKVPSFKFNTSSGKEIK